MCKEPYFSRHEKNKEKRKRCMCKAMSCTNEWVLCYACYTFSVPSHGNRHVHIKRKKKKENMLWHAKAMHIIILSSDEQCWETLETLRWAFVCVMHSSCSPWEPSLPRACARWRKSARLPHFPNLSIERGNASRRHAPKRKYAANKKAQKVMRCR